MPPGLMIVFASIFALAGLTFLIGSLLHSQSERLELPLDDLTLRRLQHAAQGATGSARTRHDAKSPSMNETAAG